MANEIKIPFIGDASSIKKAVREAGDSLDSLKNKAVGGLSNAFQGLSDRFPKLSGGLEKLGLSSEQAGGLIGTTMVAGAAVAGEAIVKFASASVSAFTKTAAEALKVQRATGLTAESASRLVAVGDDWEVSADQLATTLGRLEKNLGTGALHKYGVETVHAKDGSVDMVATLGAVADRFVATEDPTRRAALATAAFGKTWQDLVPILEQGSAGLSKSLASVSSGQVLSQDDIEAAEKYRLAMDELSDAVGDLERRVGSKLVPVLADTVEVAAAGVEAFGDLADKVGDFADAAGKAAGPFGFVTDLVKDAVLPAHALVGAVHDLAGAHGDAGAAADEAAFQHANLTDELDHEAISAKELAAAIDFVSTAQSKGKHLELDLADAKDRLADAQKAVNEKTKTAQTDVKGLEAAQKDLTSAQETAADAQSSLNDALAENHRVLTGLGPDTKEAAAATRDLAEAQRDNRDAARGVADAQERVQAAEEAIARLKGGDPKTVAEAQRKLNDATLDVADAQDDVTDAILDVNNALNKFGAGSREANKASRDYQRSLETLQDRQTALTAAQELLRVATDGYGQDSKEAAAAVSEFQAAEDALAGAQANQTAKQDIAAEAGRVWLGVLNGFTASSPEAVLALKNIEDANKALAEKTDSVKDAQQRVVDKNAEVNAALADTGTLKTHEQAARDVEKAYLAVADAEQALADFEAAQAKASKTVIQNAGDTVAAKVASLFKLGGGAGTGIASTVGQSAMNVTINAIDPKAASDSVVAALKEYQRKNGSIPIRVSG